MERRKRKARKTLHERELGPIPKATLEEEQEIAEASAEGIGGAGRSKIPTDYVWTGGKNQIDADAIMKTGATAVPALDEILIAIISAHPIQGNGQKQQTDQYRLEQALKFLIGQMPKRGVDKPEEKYESVLGRVALKFLRALYHFDNPETSLDELIWDELSPEERRQHSDPESKNNILTPYRREWHRRKHRLLIALSAHDLPEASFREGLVQEILVRLNKLGIATKAP